MIGVYYFQSAKQVMKHGLPRTKLRNAGHCLRSMRRAPVWAFGFPRCSGASASKAALSVR